MFLGYNFFRLVYGQNHVICEFFTNGPDRDTHVVQGPPARNLIAGGVYRTLILGKIAQGLDVLWYEGIRK